MKYKNWIWFIVFPFLFYLLVEAWFGWPYKTLFPERQEGYLRSNLIVIAVFLFSAAVGMAANFSHFKKLPEDKKNRRLHAIVSIGILFINYIISKFLILGSTLSIEQFSVVVGIWPVDFPLLDKILSGILLIYFLMQVIFILATKKWYRTKMLNINPGAQVSDTRNVS